ncbi:achaete-scute-like protein 4-like [Huso huso]|uniref:Achaete-scute-like protein 4-like n=1 Tax=Huso huso TaxID=61971 RepID=A0ABR0ZDC2_HUSHU
MAADQPASLSERIQYPRSMSVGLPMDHPGVPLAETFRVPFHFEPSYLEQAFSPGYSRTLSYMPFTGHLGVYDYSFEPAFIRKRNERERQRVRCVNEGYSRLREHLPQELEDKRLSKVETLRAAINYIKRLQGLLDLHASGSSSSKEKQISSSSSPSQRTESNSDGESKTSATSSPYSDSGDMSR